MSADLNDEGKWWFPKKDYGVGWGLPIRWQGWLALTAYITLMGAGVPLAGMEYGSTGEVLVAVTLSVGIALVLLIKGEPIWRVRQKDITSDAVRFLRSCARASYVISVFAVLLFAPLAFRLIPKNSWYGFRSLQALGGTSEQWLHMNEIAGIAGVAAGVVSVAITAFISGRQNLRERTRGISMVLTTALLIAAASLCPLFFR